jgi:hypothetical protein
MKSRILVGLVLIAGVLALAGCPDNTSTGLVPPALSVRFCWDINACRAASFSDLSDTQLTVHVPPLLGPARYRIEIGINHALFRAFAFVTIL